MTGRYGGAAAGGYDRAFGQVSRDFVPTLLRMARLAPGMRVLDIAAGTGAAAEGAAAVVGPSGQVVAADISPAMLEKARGRLGGLANASFAVEDGQALSFPDGSFARLCTSRLWPGTVGRCLESEAGQRLGPRLLRRFPATAGFCTLRVGRQPPGKA